MSQFEGAPIIHCITKHDIQCAPVTNVRQDVCTKDPFPVLFP